MKKIVYVGVDVGKNGGIGVVGDDVYEVFDYETPQSLIETLILIQNKYSVSWCVKEKIYGMSKNGIKQGASSIFSLGNSNGLVVMAFIALKLRYEEVLPLAWQKKMLYESDGKDTKERSLVAARRMFPLINLSLKKHHNRADALLMATWKKYKELGTI